MKNRIKTDGDSSVSVLSTASRTFLWKQSSRELGLTPSRNLCTLHQFILCYLATKRTVLTFSSQDTQDRAQKASIEALPSDVSFVTQSDYILSIVPPRDALATAKRITTAL